MQQRNVQITIRVSRDERQAFDILARRKGLTVSAYVRMIIMDLYFLHKRKGSGDDNN